VRGAGRRAAIPEPVPASAREIADLTTINNHIAAGRMTEARVLAREAFDRHRGRFWRAVRRDASLRAVFEDAGMVFPPGNGAPVYRDPVTGDILDRMTLEHSTRLADDPVLALDAANLQTVPGDQNSYALGELRRENPQPSSGETSLLRARATYAAPGGPPRTVKSRS